MWLPPVREAKRTGRTGRCRPKKGAGRPRPTHRPLGVSAEVIGVEDQATTDRPQVDEPHGLLVADLVEQANTSPEHDRVDDQPELVGQVVLYSRTHELM